MSKLGLHHVLVYDYVEDIVQQREPYREGHLGRLRRERDAGHVTMAGALGDPPRGALIVFRGVDRSAIESFALADPYVEAGLVTHWRIDPWQVVV